LKIKKKLNTLVEKSQRTFIRSKIKEKKIKIKLLLQDVETELENTKLHPRRSCDTKMKP